MSENLPIWRFVVALYAQPGIADRCIELQDRHGVDVTVLLFCCWAGRHGRRLTSVELDAARVAVRDWQSDVTGTLRALRRRLKSDARGVRDDRRDELRGALQQLEIDAERIALLTLVDTLTADSSDVTIAPDCATVIASVAANVSGCLSSYRLGVADGRRCGEQLADACAALLA